MQFVDKAKIAIKAGDGGDGCASFHREKYVARGGPDGGDGGRGGNVVFYADPNMSTLLDFKFMRHYRAERGENGRAKLSRGKNGEDLIIRVPVGTLVRDVESGRIVADMHAAGKRRIVLHGGRGGKGNARFATPTRQSPRFAQPGQKTLEHQVELELLTIADVGLLGLPNVGKSTILSVLTSARPKIANYHFTTLTPNLGVVQRYDHSFVLADIPGLIEGAAEGAGLGHDFLRHVERTRMLIHVLDISGCEGRDPPIGGCQQDGYHRGRRKPGAAAQGVAGRGHFPSIRGHGPRLRPLAGCGDKDPCGSSKNIGVPGGGYGGGQAVRARLPGGDGRGRVRGDRGQRGVFAGYHLRRR